MKNFKFKIKGNDYDVKITEVEDNVATIQVNGTEYSVELDKEVQKTQAPRVIKKRPVVRSGGGVSSNKPAAAASTTGGFTVNAPLPGSIFKLMVSEGDTVSKGDNLLIMEAMKMENNVLAEKDGVVSSLKVKEGDAVLQNDVLLVIE